MHVSRITRTDSITSRPMLRGFVAFAACAILVAAHAGCTGPERSDITTSARRAARVEPTAPASDAARRGHSHNDYTRPKPLITALESGMGSIEADIFLVEGELLVGHDRKDLRKERTLASMYLDPLAARARERGGCIHGPDERPLILLIDIKENGRLAYESLHEQLKARAETFTELSDGRLTPRAVTVIISGDCPRDDIAAQSRRWAFVDGRVQDLQADVASAPAATLVPLVSESWFSHFSWLGLGAMPVDQSARLRDLVDRAHARGYMIRFWGTPATDAIWLAQLEAGVDLINLDAVARGATFLRAHATGRGR